MTEEQTKERQRRGCLFYGCLTGAVLALIALIGLLVGLRYAKKMFTDFTDTKPATLPTVQLPEAQLNALQKRIETFKDAVRQGQTVPPLSLTADEINALIATDPDLKDFKGKLYVIIQGDTLSTQLSLPMEQLGLPIFKGRYFNGNATLNISCDNGALRITPVAVSVKGRPVPPPYMETIRKQNLAKNFNTDARAQVALDHIEDINVKDGKLNIVPKAK